VITGQVTLQLEALLTVRVRGASRTEVEINSTVDTGFSECLTLPPAIILALDLEQRGITQIRLSDGTYRRVDVYAGEIWWNGEWYAIPIQESQGDVLLGMELLHNHDLFIEVVAGGTVTVENME
jgi:clan AA aspartic protease